MEAFWSEYFIGIVEGAMTIGFCLYAVGEQQRLKMSVRRIALWVLLISVMGSGLNIAVQQTAAHLLLPGIDYSGLTLPFWILFGYFGLRRVTGEPGSRLLFVLFLSVQAMLFCRSVTYLIYSFCWPQLISGTFCWADILGFGLPSLLFTPLLALACRELYRRLRAVQTGRHVHLWLLPLFFFLLYSVQVDFYPIEDYAFANGLKILIQLCAFVTYSQTAWAVSSSAKAARESEIRVQLAHQLDLQRARVDDLESHTEEMKRIRHDRRQHVQVLRGLLEKGEVKEALAYLKDYEGSMADAIQPPLCENFVADTLCRRYEALAKQAGVKVSIHAALPKEPGVAGSDLAVILGNLWENAVAAALDAEKSRRFIRLRVQIREEQILIRMENSYGGIICQEGERFLSGKPGRDRAEGVGIASIRAMAARYGGMADFTYTPDVFTASVLLYPDKS